MDAGDLKSAIAHKIGLKPETFKLLFRGKEKEDDDNLQTAGVKDSSKVLIKEETTPVEKIPEKVETETIVVSRGGEAVAIVREEVDKLADQVHTFNREVITFLFMYIMFPLKW